MKNKKLTEKDQPMKKLIETTTLRQRFMASILHGSTKGRIGASCTIKLHIFTAP